MASNNRVDIEITAQDRFTQVFRNLDANIKGSVSGITSRLDVINNSVAGVTGTLSALGVTAAASMLTGFVKSTIDAADELGKMSQKIGVSVEDLSALKYAGELADVSLDQLGVGLKQLNKNIIEGVSGSKEQAAAFSAMGVSLRGAGGEIRSANDVMEDVAEVFAGMEDGAGKTALALKIFGKSGSDLIPLLNAGKQGLKDMRTEAEKLGQVIDERTAKAAEQFNDNLNKITLASKGAGLAMVKDLLPGLSAVTDKLVEFLKTDFGKNTFSQSFYNLLGPGGQALSLLNLAGSGGQPPKSAAPTSARPAKTVDPVLQSYLDSLKENGDAEAKRIESLNKTIEQQIGRLTKTELEQIDIQAKAWKDEGADRILVEKWVAAEKDKILTESMRKAFKKLEEDSVKRYEREKELAEESAKWKEDQIKKFADAMAKAMEEEVKQAEALAASNKEARDFADSIRELTEALDPVVGKDEELVKAEDALIAGRNRLAELNDLIAVAWAKGNQVAIEGLTQLIALQTGLNAKLEDQKKLMEDVAVLTGKIVGFNNGMPIYADDWRKGQYQYQSPNELAKQQMAGQTSIWGAPAGTIYDVNGNPISLPKYAVGTDYVPRTGPAIIHQGERIIPAGKSSAAPISVSGGISVVLPNVTRADDYPAIARGIYAELRKLSGWKL